MGKNNKFFSMSFLSNIISTFTGVTYTYQIKEPKEFVAKNLLRIFENKVALHEYDLAITYSENAEKFTAHFRIPFISSRLLNGRRAYLFGKLVSSSDRNSEIQLKIRPSYSFGYSFFLFFLASIFYILKYFFGGGDIGLFSLGLIIGIIILPIFYWFSKLVVTSLRVRFENFLTNTN